MKFSHLRSSFHLRAAATVFAAALVVGKAHARTADLDGDGICNRLDRDVDGDGIPNKLDRNVDGGICRRGPFKGQYRGDHLPNRNLKEHDIDGDGLKDSSDLELDIDGDGLKDDSPRETDIDGDGLKNDSPRETDIDGDGVENLMDIDADGDGKPDGASIITDSTLVLDAIVKPNVSIETILIETAEVFASKTEVDISLVLGGYGSCAWQTSASVALGCGSSPGSVSSIDSMIFIEPSWSINTERSDWYQVNSKIFASLDEEPLGESSVLLESGSSPESLSVKDSMSLIEPSWSIRYEEPITDAVEVPTPDPDTETGETSILDEGIEAEPEVVEEIASSQTTLSAEGQ
jgi:hypothetical protein